MTSDTSKKAGLILEELSRRANPENVAGMQRYGINPKGTLGVSIPILRQIARENHKNHALALELWESGIHEARILAAFIDDPALLSPEQMEHWASDFDSWDVCDQVCSNLFDRSPFAVQKATEWSARQETFVKRAGFVLMAALAVHDKKLPDDQFLAFLDLVEENAQDERNFVKKAVNWALRGIGKRNRQLNHNALETARRIAQQESRTARWIAADALRELTSVKIQHKLGKEDP